MRVGAETPKPTRFVSDLRFFEGNIFLAPHSLTKLGITRGPCLHSAHMVATTLNLSAPTKRDNGKQLQLHTTLEPCVYSLREPSQRLGQIHPPLRRGQNLRMCKRWVSKSLQCRSVPSGGQDIFRGLKFTCQCSFRCFVFTGVSDPISQVSSAVSVAPKPHVVPNLHFFRC